jgi:hypothetical protein
LCWPASDRYEDKARVGPFCFSCFTFSPFLLLFSLWQMLRCLSFVLLSYFYIFQKGFFKELFVHFCLFFSNFCAELRIEMQFTILHFLFFTFSNFRINFFEALTDRPSQFYWSVRNWFWAKLSSKKIYNFDRILKWNYSTVTEFIILWLVKTG